MNKKILIDLVKKEAKNLKKKATKDEIRRLGGRLISQNRHLCIYGKMTSDCFSPRAHQLIKSCAQRVYTKDGFGICESTLNGKPQLDNDGDRKDSWFSPIECFIDFHENKTNGNNKMLISYLKGDRKTLRFKKF